MASAVQRPDGVFVLRYEASDLNVCVVGGEDGFLVVDTGSSPAEAAKIEADVQRPGAGPLLCVINTHAHFDHTFGDQHFGLGSELDCPSTGTICCRHILRSTSVHVWKPGCPAQATDDALAEPGWWPFPVKGLRIAAERASASLAISAGPRLR